MQLPPSNEQVRLYIINTLGGPCVPACQHRGRACREHPERNRARQGNFWGIWAGSCSVSLCHQGVAADLGLALRPIWVG